MPFYQITSGSGDFAIRYGAFYLMEIISKMCIRSVLLGAILVTSCMTDKLG